ncbi:transmembrane protein 201-like [Rhinophrynus dorsalis]
MENGIPLPLAGLVAATGVTGILLCKFVRRKRPTHVNVNCWFCNQNTLVPYGNRNCWDCPNCEQYNGFQENGDYNKPIPAQHSEHLNHVVSGWRHISNIKSQQWVNCQTLLCKKCNNNQTTKIKQLASFLPREEDRYDEEIEVYKHHLEQMYKLCRPCQAAVEYYVKHQNRQLRALLLNHQLKRRDVEGHVQNSITLPSSRAPVHVIVLRFLASFICVFLLCLALMDSGDRFSIKDSLTFLITQYSNGSDPQPDHVDHHSFWDLILDAIPGQTLENLNVVWSYGHSHQMIMVLLGLLACIFAMILAGRIRFCLGWYEVWVGSPTIQGEEGANPSHLPTAPCRKGPDRPGSSSDHLQSPNLTNSRLMEYWSILAVMRNLEKVRLFHKAFATLL